MCGPAALLWPEAAGPPPQRWQTLARWCDRPHPGNHASFQPGYCQSGTGWRMWSQSWAPWWSPGQEVPRRPSLDLLFQKAGQSKARWIVSVWGCWWSWDGAASGRVELGGRRHCWLMSQRQCWCLPWPPGEHQRRSSCCHLLYSRLPSWMGAGMIYKWSCSNFLEN